MYFSVISERLMSQGFMLFEWIRSSRISFHVGCWTNSVMFCVIFISSMFFFQLFFVLVKGFNFFH